MWIGDWYVNKPSREQKFELDIKKTVQRNNKIEIHHCHQYTRPNDKLPSVKRAFLRSKRELPGLKSTCHPDSDSDSGGRCGVLDSGSSGPGSGPGRGHCVVFLGKTLHSHGASLHPGV